MELVDIAEELPNLIVEMIFNHVRKGSSSKCMTVTGKLNIDLIEVILEVSLNHSLELAALASPNAPKTGEDLTELPKSLPEIPEEIKVADHRERPNEESDITDQPVSAADEQQKTSSEKVASPSKTTKTSQDIEQEKGSAIYGEEIDIDEETSRIPSKVAVHRSSNASEKNDVPLKAKTCQNETSGSSFKKAAPKPNEKADFSMKAKTAKGITDERAAKKSPVAEIKSPQSGQNSAEKDNDCDPSSCEGKGDAKTPDKTVKASPTRNLRSKGNKKDLIADSFPDKSEQLQSTNKSPVKDNMKGSKLVTPATKRNEMVALASVGTTRSGRKIMKPKRIWNPDMSATEVALTQRPTPSQTLNMDDPKTADTKKVDTANTKIADDILSKKGGTADSKRVEKIIKSPSKRKADVAAGTSNAEYADLSGHQDQEADLAQDDACNSESDCESGNGICPETDIIKVGNAQPQKILSKLSIKKPEKTKWRPYECTVCKMSFRSFVRLKIHSLQEHNFALTLVKDENDKKGDSEDEGMDIGSDLEKEAVNNIEIEKPLKTKWRPYECTKCAESFRSFLRLRRHSLKVHKTNLTLKEELVKKGSEKGKQVEFPCHECGKVFSKRHGLNEHMFVHDKNTNYKCEICDKTFATHGKLMKHNKIRHSESPENLPEKDQSLTTSSTCPLPLNPENKARISNAHCVVCKRLMETYMPPQSGVTCPNCKVDFSVMPLEGVVILPGFSDHGLRYQCSLCDCENFTGNEDAVRNHIYEKHAELLTHTCQFCEMKFVYIETLNMHLIQQHPNRVYKKKANGDSNQQEQVFTGWRKMYFCGPCEKIYHTRVRLHDHIIVHHENKDLPYECTICNRRFQHRDVLNQHLRFTHANEWFKICDQCGKFFRKKVEFENHRHEDDPWRCEVCDRPFTSYSGFRIHMKKHRELPTLMCKYCGEMFHYQSFLTNHERKHTGEKPFECSVCNRKFGNSYVYNKHKKMHYAKKLKCSQCPQVFMYPSGLRQHELTHSSDRLRYACSFCEGSYVKLSSLQIHMKTKHNVDMVEMTMEQVTEEEREVAEHVTMDIDPNNLPEGLTLYSCVTCSTCYYTEEECISCQVSHDQQQDTKTAVTIMTI